MREREGENEREIGLNLCLEKKKRSYTENRRGPDNLYN